MQLHLSTLAQILVPRIDRPPVHLVGELHQIPPIGRFHTQTTMSAFSLPSPIGSCTVRVVPPERVAVVLMGNTWSTARQSHTKGWENMNGNGRKGYHTTEKERSLRRLSSGNKSIPLVVVVKLLEDGMPLPPPFEPLWVRWGHPA